MRILLLNLSVESSHEVEQALSGQGYEITTRRSLTVDEIVAVSPDILITEATPSDLSCCGVVSQIKAGPDPRTLKIVMIVQGGALERARGFDLGADDVISFPFEPLEFIARIRTQFRERQPELDLEAKLNDETLLLDSMRGDATLFTRRDEVEAEWRIITPVEEAWAQLPPPDFPNYAAGSDGPTSWHELIKISGNTAEQAIEDTALVQMESR